jgi:nucleoporin GLE1
MLDILIRAKNAPGPRVDTRDFLIASKSKYLNVSPDAAQVPSVFIYLLNFFSKFSIKNMKESSSQPMTNLVGITVAFIFGHNDLRWNDESFVDIFLAKYHKACPVLFGIYGPENTQEGRNRLGWATSKDDDDSDAEETYVAEQFHKDDMMGLAMGWSAVTLRDFKTTKSGKNSLPPWHFWQSLACIVNVPPKEVTETHLIVLKNILEHYADKFVKFYGQAATVALSKAVVEFPGSLPNSTAASGVKLLRELFQKQYGIRV